MGSGGPFRYIRESSGFLDHLYLELVLCTCVTYTRTPGGHILPKVFNLTVYIYTMYSVYHNYIMYINITVQSTQVLIISNVSSVVEYYSIYSKNILVTVRCKLVTR